MRLFDENGFYTEAACALDDSLKEVLVKFFDEHPEVDVNDVVSIASRSAPVIATGYLLRRRVKSLGENPADDSEGVATVVTGR